MNMMFHHFKNYLIMGNRFILQKSKDKGYWILTDTLNQYNNEQIETPTLVPLPDKRQKPQTGNERE